MGRITAPTWVRYFVIMATILVSSLALAEDKATSPEIEVSMDYFGKYIWRGMNLQDDSVFQPSVSLTYGGLTAAVWGNLEMSNYNDNDGEITEVDYSLEYSCPVPGFDILSVSLGVINYTFPNTQADDTTEIYGGLTLDMPFSPSIKLYRDVDDVDGTYIAFGVSHDIEKIAELASDMPIGLSMSASLGWGSSAHNKFYWGVDDATCTDLYLKLGFPIPIGSWTLTPNINYVTLLDNDIRKSDAYRPESDYFFAGVNLSTSF